MPDYFVLFPWSWMWLCGHFEDDVLEVLKVKAYFCTADKSIFKQTRNNS